MEKTIKKVIIIAVIVLLALIVILSAFKIVPTGYTGVRTTFGQISDKPVEQGINFKIPFVQSIKLINNKQQDTFIEAQVWGEAKDRTPVYASQITVSYSISPEKSAWICANITDIKNLINADLVASAIKSAMVELDVNEVTNRAKIEPLAKEKLETSIAEKYGESSIIISKVVINNMDFEEAYNQAIQAKSIAQQTNEKQAIENDTAIKKAEADKKVAIAKAEAEAEAKRIAAEAEAEANQKVSSSLTDKVLESKFYEKWNGELPTVMGNNAAIVDIGKTTEEQ